MYGVFIEPSARHDIEHHLAWLQEHAHFSGYPEAWYESIVQAILCLGDFPFSFALAPENSEFDEEVRHRISSARTGCCLPQPTGGCPCCT